MIWTTYLTSTSISFHINKMVTRIVPTILIGLLWEPSTLVLVSSRANSEIWIWVEIVYLGEDPRKRVFLWILHERAGKQEGYFPPTCIPPGFGVAPRSLTVRHSCLQVKHTPGSEKALTHKGPGLEVSLLFFQELSTKATGDLWRGLSGYGQGIESIFYSEIMCWS